MWNEWGEQPAPRRGLGTGWRVVGTVTFVAVVLGVPTDVVNTPMFARVVPVRWWEYPVLGAVSVLVGMWVGLSGDVPRPVGAPRVAAGLVLAGLSLGCPHCNRAVVWLIGMDRTLTWWSATQPVLALIAVYLLISAFRRRRRRSRRPGDHASIG